MNSKIDEKADRYLTEGRVSAILIDAVEGEFTVSGSDDDPYSVSYRVGRWECNCPARVTQCAHIVACQKITDFKSVRTVKFNDPEEDFFAQFRS